MIQNCNYLKVLEVFFVEPTEVHFIREISKRISLAFPSTRNYINKLEQEGLIVKKHMKPFDGYVANRENPDFIYYKKVYNLYTLKELTNYLVNLIWPKAIILFGSYSRGEDVESSDIDILVISNINKKLKLNLSDFEKKLNRDINVIITKDLSELNGSVVNSLKNGVVLYGEY